MDIFLIRHTSVNVPQGICYGRTDVGLKESYPEEREALEVFLPDNLSETLSHDFGAVEAPWVFSSPLSRAARLCHDLFGETHTKEDKRLTEMNFGEWEGMHWAEIKRNAAANPMKNFVDTPAPNGESFLLFHERIMGFWDELCHKLFKLQKQESPLPPAVYIVSHSGVMRSVFCRLQQIPLSYAFNTELEFGAVCRARLLNGRVVPTAWNLHRNFLKSRV